MPTIFVYGTLMKGFKNHRLIEDGASFISTVRVKGILYHLPEGYPALIEGDSVAFGEAIEIEDSSYIKGLDRLEGYYGPGCNNFYDRLLKEVELEDGSKSIGWMYFYRDEDYARENGILVEGGDWRKFMNGRRV